MMIAIKLYETTYSVHDERDALNLDEVMQLVRSLLLAAGYAESSITEYIG